MKRLSVIILPVFLLVMLAAGTIYAQGTYTVIRGDIPFGFIVGDKTFPAGNYEFHSVLSKNNQPRIQNTKNLEVVVLRATVLAENGKQVKPMFVWDIICLNFGFIRHTLPHANYESNKLITVGSLLTAADGFRHG